MSIGDFGLKASNFRGLEYSALGLERQAYAVRFQGFYGLTVCGYEIVVKVSSWDEGSMLEQPCTPDSWEIP